MMKAANTLVTILTVIIVMAVANFLASRHPVRADLTQNKIYTLSDSTRKILAGLDDIVTMRIYFTEDLPPAMQALRRDVEDHLAEFKRAAGSNLQIEFIDPASSLMEEQKVAMLGIPPVQVNVFRKDKQEVAKIYLGMAVMHGDKKHVLPVVRSVGNLEYELAEAILRVQSKRLPAIAWWEPAASDQARQDGFDLIRGEIERRYEVSTIDGQKLSELEASRFPALVLISPRSLSEEEVFSIDQYLMGGGRLIALIDRFEINQALAIEPVETTAVDLMNHYGVLVEESLVLDRSNAMAAFSGGPITYHMPYPYWPDVRKDEFNAGEPIVADLESAVLPWTSPLSLKEAGAGETDAVSVLASTSPYAVSASPKAVGLDPQSAGEGLLRGSPGKLALIAMVSGPVRSYFADGGHKAPKGSPFEKESGAGARIFAVGSSHWISDNFLGNFPANAILFQNALDAFAMGDLLIGIRSKEATSRPVAILSDAAMATIKYANVVCGPILVLLIGSIVLMFRRAHRRTVRVVYG